MFVNDIIISERNSCFLSFYSFDESIEPPKEFE